MNRLYGLDDLPPDVPPDIAAYHYLVMAAPKGGAGRRGMGGNVGLRRCR